MSSPAALLEDLKFWATFGAVASAAWSIVRNATFFVFFLACLNITGMEFQEQTPSPAKGHAAQVLECPCGYKPGAVHVLALHLPAATGTKPAKQTPKVACPL